MVAHKVIKDLCRLSGIKDIYIKLEGNTKNRITMTTAFFNAMTHQVNRLCKTKDDEKEAQLPVFGTILKILSSLFLLNIRFSFSFIKVKIKVFKNKGEGRRVPK